MSTRPFVKAGATVVSVEKSRVEVEKMLRRYGAIGFSFSINHESGEAFVAFVVPDSPAKGAPRIPVQVPVNVYDVFDRIYGQPRVNRLVDGRWTSVPMARPYTHDAKKIVAAERVAWRNLVLWIDAALSAATIGLRSIADTFAGDRMATDENGTTMRVAELLARSSAHGPRLLLLGAGDATP